MEKNGMEIYYWLRVTFSTVALCVFVISGHVEQVARRCVCVCVCTTQWVSVSRA